VLFLQTPVFQLIGFLRLPLGHHLALIDCTSLGEMPPTVLNNGKWPLNLGVNLSQHSAASACLAYRFLICELATQGGLSSAQYFESSAYCI